MRTLFNLVRPQEYGRADIDAVLQLEGKAIPEQYRDQRVAFELKSATSGEPDISTVRDFGLHYIEKWRKLHWLFGVYDRDSHGDLKLQYCLYASPAQMKPWFEEMSAYIAPDVALISCVPGLIDMKVLTTVLGDADEFSYEDARSLMKNQYRRRQYRQAADLPGGNYSRNAMLTLLRERCRYVLSRGSTLNNPHIKPSYFEGWEHIDRNHAARLRELVVEELQEEDSQETSQQAQEGEAPPSPGK